MPLCFEGREVPSLGQFVGDVASDSWLPRADADIWLAAHLREPQTDLACHFET